MSSSKTYYATLEAEEPFYFSYANYTRVYPELQIRNNGDVNEVMVSVAFPIPTASGAFYIADDHDLTVRVRFDKEEPQVFTCSPTTDGNNDTMFIDSANAFISKLKSADTALVECVLTVTPPKKY
ncbi:hypothetical protein [Mucilaginibacter sp. PAMB04168]|uniref:hypothetical protein n=1 Tax=Mucilaginibacter sp. PAMB04168 TaxID=3138567 RepID=UPI0031F620A8